MSAATAVTYIQGEVTLPFPAFVATLIILGIFTAVSLCGVRESARVAFVVLLYHVSWSFHPAQRTLAD